MSEPFRKECRWCAVRLATHLNFYGRSEPVADEVCVACLPRTKLLFEEIHDYDYILPIVFVVVGSELHVALDCAFAELASLRCDERRAA